MLGEAEACFDGIALGMALGNEEGVAEGCSNGLVLGMALGNEEEMGGRF